MDGTLLYFSEPFEVQSEAEMWRLMDFLNPVITDFLSIEAPTAGGA